MNDKLMIKKCVKCGAIVKEMKPCYCDDCGIMCCGSEMEEVLSNVTDAAVEKHVPNYEVEDNQLRVSVNHVMEEEHFIEWICFKTENREEYVYFHFGENASAVFQNASSGMLYAYCNKHGLWSTKIDA